MFFRFSLSLVLLFFLWLKEKALEALAWADDSRLGALKYQPPRSDPRAEQKSLSFGFFQNTKTVEIQLQNPETGREFIQLLQQQKYNLINELDLSLHGATQNVFPWRESCFMILFTYYCECKEFVVQKSTSVISTHYYRHIPTLCCDAHRTSVPPYYS